MFKSGNLAHIIIPFRSYEDEGETNTKARHHAICPLLLSLLPEQFPSRFEIKNARTCMRHPGVSLLHDI